MSRGRGFEISVGVFVAAAGVFLAVMIFMSGNYRLAGGNSFEIEVGFRDVSGLKPDAPVFIAGTQMGLVKEIRFHEPKTLDGKDTYFVTLTLSLPGSIDLRGGTRAYVSSQGFLGEMFVGIEPGYLTERIAPGTFIRGREMVSFADVQATADETLRTVNDVVGSFRGFSDMANDARFKDDIRLTLANAREITQGIKTLVADNGPGLSRTIRTLEENVEKGSTDLRVMAEEWRESSTVLLAEIDELVAKVNRLVESGGDSLLVGAENIRVASGDLRAAGEDLSSVSASARRITEAKETDVADIIENARVISSELRVASRSLGVMLEDMEKGRGAAGALLRDTATEVDMKNLIRNLNEASARLEELLADVKKDPERYLGNVNVRFSMFGKDEAAAARRRTSGSTY